MAETKAAAKGWTDAEKVGLLFQIIGLQGPIPWDALTLPEGRTLKACQVMIDREKTKLKKGGEAPIEATPKKGKRKLAGSEAAETPGSSAKKARGRKKKGEEEEKGDTEGVKEDEKGEDVIQAEEKEEGEA